MYKNRGYIEGYPSYFEQHPSFNIFFIYLSTYLSTCLAIHNEFLSTSIVYLSKLFSATRNKEVKIYYFT